MPIYSLLIKAPVDAGNLSPERKLADIEQRIFSRATLATPLPPTAAHAAVRHQSLRRYLAAVRHLLVLHRAVQLGDYGIIRVMIPTLLEFFYGAGASNYGPEMLYFAWLLHPDVTDRALSEGILRSALVKCTTAGSDWKAIDLALEHVNGSFAIDIKNDRNSTHSTFVTFMRQAALGTYMAVIHTFLSPDLQSNGIGMLLSEKVAAFNAKEVRPERVADQIGVPDVTCGDGGVIITSREGERAYGGGDHTGSDNDDFEEVREVDEVDS
ncbi:hypothetical protein B0T22DRAFT_512217 [Podospora appendiculata]|uniref:DUF6589 domain-containing protein n=1 Tax=Podospora appendiculata TaxID=314037 RepID=A0AAE0X9L2_9PEZI|nr:hypothetical protein B0T22DRAFT_512217 [Podospora appendiculata]